MILRCLWEHNGDDTLLWALDYPGAFTRGSSLDGALKKMPAEIAAYLTRAGKSLPDDGICPEVTVDAPCGLAVSDADSDVIFPEESQSMTADEYAALKRLVMKSALDFQALFDSIPDENAPLKPRRDTFYGSVPCTAREMYDHTRSVNDYYFAEIGVATHHEGDIAACRAHGFSQLEVQTDFLTRPACEGSYGEMWSLRKVLRRFLWHDRIHAKALYRSARTVFPGQIPDVFSFGE